MSLLILVLYSKTLFQWCYLVILIINIIIYIILITINIISHNLFGMTQCPHLRINQASWLQPYSITPPLYIINRHRLSHLNKSIKKLTFQQLTRLLLSIS